MRHLAGSRLFLRGSLLGLACLASACAFRPMGFDADIGPDPVMFSDLANLPEKPPAPDLAGRDAAVQSLTMDRAMAAAAAEELRREPFATPDPAPPRSGF